MIKPLLDRVVALLALIILSPLIMMTAILLYISNGGEVFFTQIRPGRNEKSFRLIKFKTMTDAKGDSGELLSDEHRLTAVGKWIRKLSLDELPQLFNILKGDMSFVGPRPLLMEYLPLYNEFQKRRHEVKPGITGWAQVNGRNALEWQTRFEHDVWYVDHQSFGLDLKILLRTAVKVIRAEGISSGTSVTMEKFKGNG
ncbi:MAG: sugar transferase [Cyclobacteriaceae bacterium]